MASIKQNLETIADFKEAVRSAVAALGLSASPPTSLPALKALLDGGVAPLAAKAALGGYFTGGAAPEWIDLYQTGIPAKVLTLYDAAVYSEFFLDLPLNLRWPALATVEGRYSFDTFTLSFPAATTISPSARFSVGGVRVEFPLVESIPAGPFSSGFLDCTTIYAPSALSLAAGALAGAMNSDFNFPLVAEIGVASFGGCISCQIQLPALAAVPSRAFLNSEDMTVSLPSAATVAADAFSGCHWSIVSLPLLTVAQVEAAGWFGTDEDVEFTCSDGTTQRPLDE